MRHRTPHARQHRARRVQRALLAAVMLAGAAAGLGAIYFATKPDARNAIALQTTRYTEERLELAAALPQRTVFPYSIVDGGVYSSEELQNAIERDPVAAAHYRLVTANRVLAEVVPADRYAYMSYRRGGQIYWTSHKVLLKKGETILTDGKTQIRARCGNCISLDPMKPTAQNEPDEMAFEALGPAPQLIPSHQFAMQLPGAASLVRPRPSGTAPTAVAGGWPVGPLGGGIIAPFDEPTVPPEGIDPMPPIVTLLPPGENPPGTRRRGIRRTTRRGIRPRTTRRGIRPATTRPTCHLARRPISRSPRRSPARCCWWAEASRD